MSFKSRVLITGAAHGIGRATAHALSKKGFAVGLIDRDSAALSVLARELEGHSVPAHVAAAAADVTDREQLNTAINQITSIIGPIDVLLACAGIGSLTLVPALDIAGLRQILDVNLIGVAQSIEAVLPGMIERKRGHILGVASMAGFRGFPWMVSYTASKAGLIAYLEAIRPGLKLRGISVTTVCPGFVRTAMCTDVPYKQPVKMIEPEEAAWNLVRAIERQPRNCVFPWDMRVGLAILKYMPDGLFDRLMRWYGPKALDVEF
jgi:short-subunit dehydrogenase